MDRARDTDGLTLHTAFSHTIDPFLQGHPPAAQFARARVSLCAFASAAAGIIAAWRLPLTPAWVWFALALGCALAARALRPRGARLAALALAVALCFAGWAALRAFERAPRSLEALLRDEPTPMRVEGIVQDPPRIEPAVRGEFAPFSYRAGVLVTRFTLRAQRVGSVGSDPQRGGASRRVQGSLWARVDEPLRGLRAGDRVAVQGLARAVGAPTNPGERDARPLARQRSVAGSLYIPEATLVERLAPDAGFSPARALLRFRHALRQRASDAIDAAAARMDSADARALLRALILGDRGEELSRVRDAAREAGLSHMLAISGLHIGALAYLLLLGLRLTGDRGALEPVVVALLIGLYLFAIPARAPALRAGIMVLTFLAAEMGGRRYSRLAALALSALLILLWKPLELFDVGFQLSYSIVAGLILFAPWLDARIPGRRPLLTPARARRSRSLARRLQDLASKTGRAARATFIVTLCATLVAIPVKAFHMAMLAPLGPITTTLAMPFLLAALCVGGSALLLGMLAPALAAPLGFLAWLALTPMLALMFAVDAIPYSFWRIPAMSLPWSIAVFVLLGSCMWGAGGPNKRRIAAAGVVLAAWTAGAWWSAGRLPSRVVLRVDMLNVGDGACFLLRSGGEALLWDCGSSNLAIGRFTLPGALRELGVWRIDRVLITHADMDHYSAIPDLARAINLSRVHITSAFRASAQAEPAGPDAHLLAALARRGVAIDTLAAGDEITLGEVRLRFLWPPTQADPAMFREDNEASLAALVSAATEAGERRLLLTGDIEGAALADLRRTHPDLRVHALELPHHGGFRDESLAFARALDPEVVLQSTGPSRIGDERWDSAKAGRTWLMTAEVGAVAAELVRDGGIRTYGTRSAFD